MADFQALKNSGHFWDNTACLPTLLDRRFGYLISNTAGKGASTLLSLLQYYADRTLADPAHFSGLAMEKDRLFREHLGKYRVFHLDFSDYHGSAVEDTVDYLYRKAEELYRRHADLYYPNLPSELTRTAIAVHNRTLDAAALCNAFHQLFRAGKLADFRLGTLLLIDNAVLLEQAAEHAEWHTWRQLRDLLNKLLPSALRDRFTKLVLMNSLPAKRDAEEDGFRYTCCNFDLPPRELSDTPSERAPQAVPPEYQYAMPEIPPEPVSPPAPFESWDAFYNDLQRLLDEKEARIAREAAIRAEQERIRYLLPPPKDFPRISPNLGARRFSVPTDTPQYQARNQLLRDLYRRHCKSSEELYEAMQRLDGTHRTDVPWDNRHADPLQDQLLAPAEALGWKPSPNHSRYWLQYRFSPREKPNFSSGSFLKTYISFPGEAICQPFLDLTLYLLHNAKESFGIKVSAYVRDDTVCCWICLGDLPLLKDYVSQHPEQITQPLPFVPYWHGIGLTQEIYPSYNALLSEIFFAYFSTVSRADRVSLARMLDSFAQDWNRSKPQVYWKDIWKECNALLFLLVLDSFSVILKGLKPEDSILLNQDDDAVAALEESYCWDDLREYQP